MEKRETALRKNQRCAEVYSDTGREYVLPDYLGEIRKILSVGAEIRPAAKYSAGQSTEASGIVVYDVIYTDADGALSAASFTSDYDLVLAHQSEDADSLHLDSRIVSFSVRPAGPRKLSAKATVAAAETLSYHEDVYPRGTAFSNGHEPEVLEKEIRTFLATESENVERELAECIVRLDGATQDEVSVIFSHAEAECESVSVTDGEAAVKGCVTVYAIINNEEDTPYTVSHKIPFSENIPYPDTSEGAATGLVSVSSLSCAVSADDEGCEVVANIILDIAVRCLGNESATVITDAYLCDSDTENTYTDFSYTELVFARRDKIAHTAKISRSDEALIGLDEPLILFGTARVGCTPSENELSVSGTVKYTGVATAVSESGERSYMPLKLEVPLDETLALSTPLSDSQKIEVRASVIKPTVSFDPEWIYISSTIDVSAVALEDKKVSVLESSEAKDGPLEERGATVTVYYPEPADTLFSVAKAHRTKVLKLARDNALTESVVAGGGGGALAGVKRLIIY